MGAHGVDRGSGAGGTGSVSQLGTDNIADDAVTTDKLADDAVTTDKLADDSVTIDKLGLDPDVESVLDDASIADMRTTLGVPAATNGEHINPKLKTQTLTDGANIAWDMNSGGAARVTLGGNRTLDNPTNVQAGGWGFLDVIQDGTGSRTLTWGSNFKFVLGVTPTLSTAASARDRFFWSSFDGTSIDITHAKGMA